MGALHPVLFFAGVYVVVLLFSIFICSALFYSCSANSTSLADEALAPVETPVSTPVVAQEGASAVVMR